MKSSTVLESVLYSFIIMTMPFLKIKKFCTNHKTSGLKNDPFSDFYLQTFLRSILFKIPLFYHTTNSAKMEYLYSKFFLFLYKKAASCRSRLLAHPDFLASTQYKRRGLICTVSYETKKPISEGLVLIRKLVSLCRDRRPRRSITIIALQKTKINPDRFSRSVGVLHYLSSLLILSMLSCFTSFRNSFVQKDHSEFF